MKKGDLGSLGKALLDKKWFIYITVFCLALLKFVFLDMDTPSYFISYLSAEDEAYYSVTGIQKYLLGIDPNAVGMHTNEYFGLCLYNHYLVYLSLHFFENNFWAFRLFPVIVSIILSLLLVDSLRIVLKNKYFLMISILVVSFDFTLFMYSRYNGPQIYSMTLLTLLLWLFIKYQYNSRWQLFLLGFVCFVLISFVYIFNLYILFGFGFYFLVLSVKERKIKFVLFFSLGLIAAFVLYLGALKSVNVSVSDVLNTMQKHCTEVSSGDSDVFSIVRFVKNQLPLLMTTFINNNLFKFNQSLLLLFSLAIGLCIVFRKYFNRVAILCALILFFAFLQHIMIPGFSVKKLTVLFPVVVLFSFYYLDVLFLNILDLKKTLVYKKTIFTQSIATHITFNYLKNL